MPETTTTYRRHHARKAEDLDISECCDVFQFLTVPCVPLGRAALLAEWSTCSVFLIVFFVGLCYVGSLVCFGIYWIGGLRLFGTIQDWALVPFGWAMYVIGPVNSSVGVTVVWGLHEFGCGLSDEVREDCDRRGPTPVWVIASFALNTMIVLIAFGLRYVLQQRYQLQAPRDCCSECCTCCAICCCPLCVVANAMQKARDAQAYEAYADELPGYTA